MFSERMPQNPPHETAQRARESTYAYIRWTTAAVDAFDFQQSGPSHLLRQDPH